MKRVFFSAIAVFLSSLLSLLPLGATPLGKISGYIYDAVTKKPIPDANILVVNTNLGAASRDGGFYLIDRIPAGNYDISVRVIGYETATELNVQVAGDIRLNFYLHPKVIELDPILVIATLTDHRQSQVSAAVEVLTPPRLAARNAATVGEALKSIGSVNFNSYDGIAGTQTASIRGANADQVVVLLDGLRLNTAQGGGVDLNLIPVAAIERVELVRGGHSALLGSDAIGGAVQLISKETIDPRGFSYGLNSTIGSFGTRALNFSGSHRIGLMSTFLNYNRLQSDGDFRFKLPSSEQTTKRINNDYQGDNFFLKSKLNLNERHQLQAIFHNLIAKKGNAGSVNINPWTNQPMTTPHARAEVDRKLAAVQSEHQLTTRFRLEENVFYQVYDYHYQDPDGWAPTDDRHKNSAIGLQLQGQVLASRYLHVIAGTELRQDRLNSTKFKVDDRNIQSIYGLAEVNFPWKIFGLLTQWNAIPALRWDNYSDVAAQLSPKFGVLVSTGEITTIGLRGNFGRSFRIPTFDDLYWPDEVWVRGNPDLKPETGNNFDLGLNFSRKTSTVLSGDVSYFKNKVTDLISWNADASGVWMPMNIGRAKIEGVETSVKYHLPQSIAYLELFHTWMKATDDASNAATKGKRLIYRPDSKLDLIIGTLIKGLSVNLNFQQVSKRFVSADNARSLPSYSLLNGNIGYSLPVAGFTVDAKFQVNNLLDKSIYVIDGYPSPGRELRFSLGVKY
ncbi:MAG: TonB-dependent receptor [candidate division KSB1 bacterium]|nr:TonB-dependent receptor [candidate division KSB1 bacterium]MDZ7335775.1 TonB-dependent receptor [candidate division KSB1 bacterium]MDZ7358648.1 TonB-dependent receptor [candidate division KSB1 bacterium]MDZ7400762.1 TonB-dependent receptor [candidate division KSB1 bacterium]